MLARLRASQSTLRAPGEARLVGRREELQRIDATLEQAQTSRGGALAFLGAAGIGKTRLLDEARVRAALAGMSVIRIRCNRGDMLRPLCVLVDLVSRLLEMPGAAGCDPGHVEGLRQLTQARPDADPVDVSSDSLASPIVRRVRLLASVADLIDAVSTEAPLVIQIDDAQWMSESVAPIINDLVEWSASRPVAWFLAMRRPRHREIEIKCPQASVGGLDPTSAAQLLDELLRARSQSAEASTRDALLARGAGSPLFLRELVRHWSTVGTLESLPTSLVALLETGLSHLSDSAQRTLQVAAVLGTHATVERVEHIARNFHQDFINTIWELEAAGVLVTDAAGAMYGHVLWAEAALSHLSPGFRRMLHRHAAESFDGEMALRPTTAVLWESARHWEAAGDPAKARAAILCGAEQLEHSGFTAEAAEAYGRALRRTIGPTQRLSVMERRIDALWTSGRIADTIAEIQAYQTFGRDNVPGFDPHNGVELIGFRARSASPMTSTVLFAMGCAA